MERDVPCPGCRQSVNPVCPDGGGSRDLRTESFIKGVGVWLMAIAVLMVLLWIPIPVRDMLRGRVRAGEEYWFLWSGVLVLAFVFLLGGRGLYRFLDVARVLVGGGAAFGSILVFLMTVTFLLHFSRELRNAMFVLLGINAIVWAGVGIALLQGNPVRICRHGDLYRDARPVARFYANLWFWLLAAVHGGLFVYLTIWIWR